MSNIDAERPTTGDGRAYHLGTMPGDLAERCILVGDPGRATRIARGLLDHLVKVGDHRGLVSYTGTYESTVVSVVTTGMGGASAGIVLPEAVRSGARAFIRVGSCGALKEEVKVGDLVVATGAVRLDGASLNWAPIEWPAVADWRVVAGIMEAARTNGVGGCHHGIGVTTDCFNEGQARPDDGGYVPPRLKERHDELVRRGALFYAMEEAAIFTWCSTHGGYPCGAVNTVYANRITGDFAPGDDALAAKVALDAIVRLSVKTP